MERGVYIADQRLRIGEAGRCGGDVADVEERWEIVMANG
jgi:hypothetical protein